MARDRVQQRGSGVQVDDVLAAQNVFGLFEDVALIGRHLGRGAARDELLDPPGIEVDQMADRTQPGRHHPGEVADTVRAAGHQAQEAAPADEPGPTEVVGLPVGDLGYPVRQLRRPLGCARGATGLEDQRDRRR